MDAAKIIETSASKNNRKIQVFGDRYTDGNISYSIGVYDKEGNCDWIGGNITLYIKDTERNIIKTHIREIREGSNLPNSCMQKEPYINVYIGSKIIDVRSMNAEYRTYDGEVYYAKDINLSRILD